jgi:hypothetical protein
MPSVPRGERIEHSLDDHGFEKASESDKQASAVQWKRALEQPSVPEPVTTLISSAENFDIVAEIQGKYDKDPLFK